MKFSKNLKRVYADADRVNEIAAAKAVIEARIRLSQIGVHKPRRRRKPTPAHLPPEVA